ncbi:MAG TPA: sigma-70 family RNA polymerase sigma factor [Gemmata sp.]|nr:sigma-70 family RNA polymerase sigma factor [Gemmata sp.]
MTIQLSAKPSSVTSGVSIHYVNASDGDLLARWVVASDSAALDVLVRRHGTMVLGVCRRLLGNTADAEDAFQVTFLILIRKAGTLTSPGQVGGWLHGVAFQVSRRMRADLARRRVREEAMTTDYPSENPPDDTSDVRRVLDEELDRLPEKYRLPIVLCELEGLTLDEAARRLGWPKGTVAGRLSRGRELLRRRLSRRRGLVFPVLILGAPALPGLDLTPHHLPDELVSATLDMAGSPDSPTAQAASAIADAVTRNSAFRSWQKYTIAILIASLLSAAALQARSRFSEPSHSDSGEMQVPVANVTHCPLIGGN